MPKTPLGPAVADLREKKSWTQEELAGKVRMKVETLRALEQGTRPSRPTTIRKVAKALGVTSEELHDLAEKLDAGNAAPEVAAHPQDIDSQRMFRLLAERTKLAATRTNLVRTGPNLPELTLDRGLYVPRKIENKLLRLVSDFDVDTDLIVIEGEPGTGKSSLLWSIQRHLADAGTDAWLFDASDLTAIFGAGQGGTILQSGFLELFDALARAGRHPIFLIDTADAALNTKAREQHLFSLLSEFSVAGVRVLAASRPGEARKLSVFNPRPVRLLDDDDPLRLLDYDDEEFERAVRAYSQAFVTGTSDLHVDEHAAAILEAAAQGYPIGDICRNPLTLRMLYSVYAPQQINAREIDIVSLYRAYWERRVASDIRTNAPATPASDTDLSASVMRIAIVMLAEGTPELPRDLLARDLESAGLRSGELEELQSRGVTVVSQDGSSRTVAFFHQTFFEHAAAVAVLRLGGPQAIQAFADRWATHEGNLFLGATLERALVLAGEEFFRVREASDRILDDLAHQDTPAARSILVYAFVHRAAVPESVNRLLRERVVSGDAMVIERLLALGGNAPRRRRRVMIEVLGLLLATDDSRRLRRTMRLLLRFCASDIALVAGVIKGGDLTQRFIEAAERYSQARDLYLDFLGRYFTHNPEWSLQQLAALLSDCFRRRADNTAFQVLRLIHTHGRTYPEIATALEHRAGIDREGMEDLLCSEQVAEEFGRIFLEQWHLQHVNAAHVLAELQSKTYRGISLTARLNGLAALLLETSAANVTDAFRRSAEVSDPTTRAMLGRITWTKVLPQIATSPNRKVPRAIFRELPKLSADGFKAPRSAQDRILFYVVANAPMTKELFARLLGDNALSDKTPWLDTNELGRRLIEGCAAGITGAKIALAELVKAPASHPRLAQAALAQMRHVTATPEMKDIGLKLAATTQDPEATRGFLDGLSAPRPEWRQFTPDIRRMTAKLRALGGVKKRRQAIGIELQMVRWRLDGELDWASIAHLAEREPDDRNQALLAETLGHFVEDDPAEAGRRLAWLIEFAQGKEEQTRRAVLDIISLSCYAYPEIIAGSIDSLFDIAFAEKTDGNIVARLSNPIFILYRNGDPRVPRLAETFVTRCTPLSTQSCLRACAKLRHLFGLIMRRMDQQAKRRLLALVPGLNRHLAHMIVQGAAESETDDLSNRLGAIAENPATHGEIVNLVSQFRRRELRVSGLERWTDLYTLVDGPTVP
jgi:transcriptional regulator with XRE-family HTH domain